MILIDTNVLLRSAQPAHSQFTAAKNAVKSARLRGYTPCIVPQVIYEYWVVATRPLGENGLERIRGRGSFVEKTPVPFGPSADTRPASYRK